MKHKAILLDRDGIINLERGGYTWRMEDFEFVEGLVKALKRFVKHDYKLIVISNQSGIAKGVYTREDVEKLHAHVQRYMRMNGIEIEEIYYCPHHPDTGKCLCRKPDSLLVEKALARYDIDPLLSYFIGDRERDIQAAEKAGVKGILIESNTPLIALAEKITNLVHPN
jgi:D-glycero-D-manno-heptose 1,7-bisphosphate phosphatase